MPDQARRLQAKCKAKRPGSTARRYDARWQRASKQRLAQYPLCAECERRGVATPATVTDHVVPHRGDAALFWDPANWQSLCKPCHDAKTRRGE